jgi:hypothetical protein
MVGDLCCTVVVDVTVGIKARIAVIITPNKTVAPMVDLDKLDIIAGIKARIAVIITPNKKVVSAVGLEKGPFSAGVAPVERPNVPRSVMAVGTDGSCTSLSDRDVSESTMSLRFLASSLVLVENEKASP